MKRDPQIRSPHGSRRAVASPVPIVRAGLRDWAVPSIAIALLVAAHLFDYVSFLVMTARHGLGAELNPIVIRLAEEFGLAGLTLAKLASVVFLAFVAVLVARSRPKAAVTLVFIGISAGLVGGVSNIASI
jgi:hypothetical protein